MIHAGGVGLVLPERAGQLCHVAEVGFDLCLQKVLAAPAEQDLHAQIDAHQGVGRLDKDAVHLRIPVCCKFRHHSIHQRGIPGIGPVQA